jgi:hypothetical protein
MEVKGFEEFVYKKRSINKQKEAQISITKTGIFCINGLCMRKYFKDFDYVVFLYSDIEKQIAIKPMKNNEDNTYIISRIKSKKSNKIYRGTIGAKSFFDYFKIPYKEKVKAYSVSWNDEEKFLIIDINS